MPAEIRYKNSVIATVAAGESKFLDCYGKKMASNVVVTLPEGYVIPKGGLSITANGTHDVTDKASVAVNVPIPDGYIKPSGTLSIAENGTYDVVDFVSVEVNVEPALQEKTVTKNGTVTPDERYDGLSKVTVNVADSPIPIEVSTEAEMTALLESGEVGGVYKYVGETTDAYENGALYVLEEGASLISFTIDGTSYEAEEGMTWGEWCDSDYNTGGYSIGYADGIYGFVVNDGAGTVVNVEGETAIISNGTAYTTYSAGPA